MPGYDFTQSMSLNNNNNNSHMEMDIDEASDMDVEMKINDGDMTMEMTNNNNNNNCEEQNPFRKPIRVLRSKRKRKSLKLKNNKKAHGHKQKIANKTPEISTVIVHKERPIDSNKKIQAKAKKKKRKKKKKKKKTPPPIRIANPNMKRGKYDRYGKAGSALDWDRMILYGLWIQNKNNPKLNPPKTNYEYNLVQALTHGFDKGADFSDWKACKFKMKRSRSFFVKNIEKFKKREQNKKAAKKVKRPWEPEPNRGRKPLKIFRGKEGKKTLMLFKEANMNCKSTANQYWATHLRTDCSISTFLRFLKGNNIKARPPGRRNTWFNDIQKKQRLDYCKYVKSQKQGDFTALDNIIFGDEMYLAEGECHKHLKNKYYFWVADSERKKIPAVIKSKWSESDKLSVHLTASKNDLGFLIIYWNKKKKDRWVPVSTVVTKTTVEDKEYKRVVKEEPIILPHPKAKPIVLKESEWDRSEYMTENAAPYEIEAALTKSKEKYKEWVDTYDGLEIKLDQDVVDHYNLVRKIRENFHVRDKEHDALWKLGCADKCHYFRNDFITAECCRPGCNKWYHIDCLEAHWPYTPIELLEIPHRHDWACPQCTKKRGQIYNCEFCGREFKKSSKCWVKHEIQCDKNPANEDKKTKDKVFGGQGFRMTGEAFTSYLLPEISKYVKERKNHIYAHDNAPYWTKEFLQKAIDFPCFPTHLSKKAVVYPSRSPDFNPIETIFGIIKYYVSRKIFEYRQKNDKNGTDQKKIKAIQIREWTIEIFQGLTQKQYTKAWNGVMKNMKECISAEGDLGPSAKNIYITKKKTHLNV